MWGSRCVGVAGHVDVGDRRHDRSHAGVRVAACIRVSCRPTSCSTHRLEGGRRREGTAVRRRSRPSPGSRSSSGHGARQRTPLRHGQDAESCRSAPLVRAGGEQRPTCRGLMACPSRRPRASTRSGYVARTGRRHGPRLDRLHRADLVVGGLQAGQRDARRRDGRLPRLQVDAVRPRSTGTDTVSPAPAGSVGGRAAAQQHRRVLDRAVYDPARSGERPRRRPSTPRWHAVVPEDDERRPRRGGNGTAMHAPRGRCRAASRGLAAFAVQAQRVGPAAVESRLRTARAAGCSGRPGGGVEEDPIGTARGPDSASSVAWHNTTVSTRPATVDRARPLE